MRVRVRLFGSRVSSSMSMMKIWCSLGSAERPRAWNDMCPKSPAWRISLRLELGLGLGLGLGLAWRISLREYSRMAAQRVAMPSGLVWESACCSRSN